MSRLKMKIAVMLLLCSQSSCVFAPQGSFRTQCGSLLRAGACAVCSLACTCSFSAERNRSDRSESDQSREPENNGCKKGYVVLGRNPGASSGESSDDRSLSSKSEQ